MVDNTQKKTSLPVLQGKTCFESLEESQSECKKKSCKQWIDFARGCNCTLVTTKSGPLTLNEIGKIYGLTRMRICQIEKNIYRKIRDFIQQ